MTNTVIPVPLSAVHPETYNPEFISSLVKTNTLKSRYLDLAVAMAIFSDKYIYAYFSPGGILERIGIADHEIYNSNDSNDWSPTLNIELGRKIIEDHYPNPDKISNNQKLDNRDFLVDIVVRYLGGEIEVPTQKRKA